MGYKYSFIDNQTYGADDINAAVSRLTTAGVSICPTDENLINAMNTVTSELVSDGVEYDADSCLVIDEGETIKIRSGTAFFDDGVTLVVDEEGITLAKEAGKYVYLYHDVGLNSCYACIESELPADKYVLLAQIDDNAKVMDRRKYAVSKVAPNAINSYVYHTVDIRFFASQKITDVVATFDMGHPNFSHIAFYHNEEKLNGWTKFGDDGSTEFLKFVTYTEVRFQKRGSFVDVYVDNNNTTDKVLGMTMVVF